MDGSAGLLAVGPPAVEPLSGRQIDRATALVEPLTGELLGPAAEQVRGDVGRSQIVQVEDGPHVLKPADDRMLAVRRHDDAQGITPVARSRTRTEPS